MKKGRSPPRHRHDGSSPLPLGMDAGPAPIQWNGVNTVWPHDPRTGWSYCVVIPSWITIPQATTVDGISINPTVFYRVQVGIQSPQGFSTVRGILRRFSDFLKLFSALKQVFPKKKVPAAPPKNMLMRINSSHSLLQERRWALEDWISRLLADIEISRSAPLASFLELEAAARFAINAISEGHQVGISEPGNQISENLTTAAVPRSSSAMSIASGEASYGLHNRSDGTNDTAEMETPSKTSDGGLDIKMEALTIDHEAAIIETHEYNRYSVINANISTEYGSEEISASEVEASIRADGTTEQKIDVGRRSRHGLESSLPTDPAIHMHQRRGSHESISSGMSSVRESEQSVGPSLDGLVEGSVWGHRGMDDSLLNLEAESALKGAGVAFPMDQRGKVRRVIVMLQRRLSESKADMEEVIARLNQETAVKEFLATKVRDLEAELDNTRRKSRDVLQQAVSLERDRVTNVQWELEECRAALMSLEAEVVSEKNARISLEERLKLAEASRDTAEKETADAKDKFVHLQRDRDMIEAQARADKKVLAKEIKSLRQAQLELKLELEVGQQAKSELEIILQDEREKHDQEKLARAKFLHEVAALRQRLKECGVEYLAKEEDKSASKGSSSVGSDALDLLSTSDNRIGLLLAEAQLLAQQGLESLSSRSRSPVSNGIHSNGDINSAPKLSPIHSGTDDAMMDMITEVFIDNAQLRKAMNSLTRGALFSSQRGEKEDEPVIRKSVLQKFLGAQ